MIDDIIEIIRNEFKFIMDFGYEFTGIKHDDSIHGYKMFSVNYLNNVHPKIISVSGTIKENSQVEFWITSSVTNMPYDDPNDFVGFDIYIKKKLLIETDTTLLFDIGKIDIESIKAVIINYAKLFRKHGEILINSKARFPGNFPRW